MAKKPSKQNFKKFLTGILQAFGESRNSMIKNDINLLPNEVLSQRRFDAVFKRVYFIFVVIFIIACTLTVIPYSISRALVANKERLEVEIKALSHIEELEANVIKARGELEVRQDFVNSLNKNDVLVQVVLNTMEKVIPKKMHITSLTQANFEEKDKIIETLQIKGASKDKESIADFQRSLKESGLYKDVFVINITETDKQPDKQTVIEYDEAGMPIEKEVTVKKIAGVDIAFEMTCILNEWE